jgi:polysaccharide biosynthesis protein PslG
MLKLKLTLLFIGIISLTVESATAQQHITWEKIGDLETLTTRQINTSRWSIGGETLDRDYADYHAYKQYLDDLGAKRIRLQGGWAKCEQEKGVYDFQWLDKIIDDAVSRGVQPWLQTSYGNPIYEGGGDAALAGGIPTSEEALAAWDAWVEALVTRYKDKVPEWEIWNEPDISKKFTAQEFAEFHVRTSEIIRRIQPNARIIALGLAGLGRHEYVESILQILKEKNRLEQFNVLTFHGYNPVPEASYTAIEKLADVVHGFNPNIEMWQGENGAPSTVSGESVGALRQFDWSEVSQAKWVLRRMLADMGHGVDVTSIFQISDMHYGEGDHMTGYNSKGLLMANPDGSIERPKLSYYAYQHAVTLFSEKVRKLEIQSKGVTEGTFLFAYEKDKQKHHAVTLWNGKHKPEDDMGTVEIDFSIDGISINTPILVNLFDGSVYAIPKENFSKKRKNISFKAIPVGDWPVVILDRSWVKLK